MAIYTISAARAQLSSLIGRAQKGERIIITRNGRPVAVLIGYDREKRHRTPGSLKGKVRIDDSNPWTVGAPEGGRQG